jgi:hypothetical protein
MRAGSSSLDELFTDPATAPRGLHIFPNTGYDGQIFYRLGLDPARMAHIAFGIRLDTSYRLQRIGYPALGWLFSAGQHGLLPAVLIAINVAGLVVLGWLGGVRDLVQRSRFPSLRRAVHSLVAGVARHPPLAVRPGVDDGGRVGRGRDLPRRGSVIRACCRDVRV